ncbi:DUF6651 domain-containing protein [Cupriavidus campinensis]|uniref:DUF6651 domain-containing protein n=1 Tax=Cupriavidus campinensis TaxID=151783 RepID=A0ABY3ET38_9BURK|nr:DUF6651 domain-containing protein [Cupriavidus campinensis]TSP13946.1 hypothetical protein FGG12_05590 [Cupriavidus campinensis]
MNKFLMALLARFNPFFMGAGGEDDDEAAKTKAAEEEAARKQAEDEAARKKADEEAAAAKNKPTDAEAKLIKEVMQRKEREKQLQAQLSQFEGLDPAEIKQLLADKAAAAQAKKEAEERELEQKGEWDRLRQRMADEHTQVVTGLRSELDQLKAQLTGASSTINELTIGSQFNQSGFIAEELTLTPTKARVVYGQHFDLVDGKVVGYDKPRGEANRTALVDSLGEPVGFEDALRKIVEADPDKDHLVKVKTKPGSGSGSRQQQPTNGKGNEGKGDASSFDKIAAGLKSLGNLNNQPVTL